ncbi:hypothetical protein GCM10010129_52330 [Streptomyces fumigatiscleroticus]|nr:hypothetical protein GCM10010129_52330 [Streptomyces fumigatiscleroticus]
MRVRVTARDAAAIAVIAVPGEVSWAAVPASDAATPCIVSIPAECRPRAWPESSPGVRAIRRSCWTRPAPKPTEATAARAAASGGAGCRKKSRYGAASSTSSGMPRRGRSRDGSSRPTVTSPANIPSAAQAKSVPAACGA